MPHQPKASHRGVSPTADFSIFMRQYQDMVFSTAARLVNDEAVAEDISQDTFLKAYEHFDMLAASPTAGGWLKTVATRLGLNHLQRYRRRWSFFSELGRGAGSDDQGEQPEVEFAGPETFFEGVDAAERGAQVRQALSQLPDHQRVPLVLHHFEDFSYEEISRQTGVSLSKVKTDILRGRAALAGILTGESVPTTHTNDPRKLENLESGRWPGFRTSAPRTRSRPGFWRRSNAGRRFPGGDGARWPWPLPARGAFLVASAAAAAVMIAAGATLLQNPGTVQVAGEVARRFAWLGLAGSTLDTLLSAARNVILSPFPPSGCTAPSPWWAAAMPCCSSVGAAAYRTYFTRR